MKYQKTYTFSIRFLFQKHQIEYIFSILPSFLAFDATLCGDHPDVNVFIPFPRKWSSVDYSIEILFWTLPAILVVHIESNSELCEPGLSRKFFDFLSCSTTSGAHSQKLQ